MTVLRDPFNGRVPTRRPKSAMMAISIQFLMEKTPPRQALMGFRPMCVTIFDATRSKMNALLSRPRNAPPMPHKMMSEIEL
jgi:hypothetical protein